MCLVYIQVCMCIKLILVPVDIFKDGKHHFFFTLWGSLVLGMTARMNDSIHVQVQVVEFHIVWIWLGCVNWNFHSTNFSSLNTQHLYPLTPYHKTLYHLLLHAVNYYGRILFRQPPKKSGNSHFSAETKLGHKFSR